MSKKGVSKISGNSSPKIGEATTYTVTDWYPATPLNQRNVGGVTWELFKKRSNGRFTTTNIKKTGSGTFTFGEVAQRNTYRLEAYLYESEGDGSSTIDITPQPVAIPRINKVELQYVDDSPGTVFSYREKMRARAQCVNLTGQKLKFSLWEDDAVGDGHDANNLLIETKEATVDRTGVATAEFMLTRALMQKAMQGETDPKQLEFYVTVEYFQNRKHATDNVNVNNPSHVPATTPQPRPQQPASNSTPSQPAQATQQPASNVPPRAANSPAADKPQSQKEEKGIVDRVTDWWNKLELWDWAESPGTIKPTQPPTQQSSDGKAVSVVNGSSVKVQNCNEKYCIKRGDKSELIREINIRLAGFGGNVPTDEFTERTEKMIKQFQKDYMKVPENGKVCGNVLRAIDEFQAKFSIDFSEVQCKCKKCTGFGDGSNKGVYLKGNAEAHHRYEYPGIHRSLLSSMRSVKFYLAKDGRYSFNKVSSGYRCRFHAEYLKKPTTNHMGKALDLHFNDKKGRTRTLSDIETIRKDIFNKYLGAKWDWKEGNIFNLESTRVGATTWVHYDVREFDSIYLEDKFFAKDVSKLNGKSMVLLAIELGFTNTCSCMGGGSAKSTEKDTTKKDNKYKWSHSEFGNLIAMRESSDDYNKCNKTKGGLKVVNDVKVVELTIAEIQKKQEDRDVFAVGRYQLIPNTLNAAVTSLSLDTSKKLDEEMQDKIFDEYLIKVKRPKIIAYLEGQGTVEDAMYSSAQEWASIGVEKGKRISDKVTKDKKGKVISREERYAEGGESYYAGDGLNNAHITPEQIKNALINSKDANK
jgi:muramidase (phage lysozyme)